MAGLLTKEQVASKLQISPNGVLHMVRARTIPFIKLGHRTLRFREQDIEAWIAKKVR